VEPSQLVNGLFSIYFSYVGNFMAKKFGKMDQKLILVKILLQTLKKKYKKN